ncbi:MAG: hypothetical protein ACYC1C_07050 [Chloroflexota bacterium]
MSIAVISFGLFLGVALGFVMLVHRSRVRRARKREAARLKPAGAPQPPGGSSA